MVLSTMLSRRRFLARGGAAVAGALANATCRSSGPGAPAVVDRSYRAVAQTLLAAPTIEGAGVHLRRAIGQPLLRHLDPFVLLDRMYGDDPREYVPGFPDHPHRGFETVTVMLEGRFKHHDSRGNEGVIRGGGAQWMTAGRGIVHSEIPAQSEGMLSAFQLWVNLPATEKMCPQFYEDLAPDRIAEARVSAAGSLVRVIAGDVAGLVGPVRPRPTRPTLLTLSLADDAPFELEVPADHAAFAFVHEGAVDVGPENASTSVPVGALAVLSAGKRVRFRARERASTVLFAAARPIGEPIVQRGPFVMNTEEEIERAFADYRAGVLDRA
jgi:redox-sensitive bicupin YhaK (pirin superfamily)